MVESVVTDIFKYNFNYKSHTDTWDWDLVTSAIEAREIDPNYQLASLNDLHNYVEACGFVFEGIVRVVEGEFAWSEYYDGQGEYFCEYIHVKI